MALTRQFAEKKRRSESSRKSDVPEDEEPLVKAGASRKSKALLEGMDEVLDDIDNVLVENAAEFIKAYVQKGGE